MAYEPARELVVGTRPALAVREWRGGGSKAIVLLHGLGHNLEVWTPVAEMLPADFRTVAIDLRGHGRSDSASGQAYADHERDVVAVMDALAIERALFVGHSWGARVALHLAATRPDRCTGVLAIEQALWDYEPPAHYLTDHEPEPLPLQPRSDEEATVLRSDASGWGAVWAAVVERSLEQTPQGWVQRPVANDVRALTLAEARAQPVEHLYREIASPVVMLFATNDEDFGFAPPIGRKANVAHIVEVLPNARVGWVDGEHAFLVDNPAPVADGISALLAPH